MDRKLKERVTGAVLLALIAIIFIPWVLDGEIAAPTEERTLEMPVPMQTITISDRDELDRPVMPSLPQPVPSTPAPEPTREPPKPVTTLTPSAAAALPPQEATAQAEPARESQPPATVAAAPAPTRASRPPPAQTAPAPSPRATIAADPTAGWAVQVGSFSSQANANKLAARLVALQYKAFVSRKSVDGRVWYRVRIGPRATRAEAVELSKRLKRDSQAVAIVPHP